MSDQTRPAVETLPSNARLLAVTAVAILVAAIILTTAVLPAEYGIDPTGIGRRLGLTGMSRGAHSSTQPAAAAIAAAAPEAAVIKRAAPFRSDTMTLTLQGGDTFVFSWTTDGGPVNFDMHGERPNAGDESTSFWKDKQQGSANGSFTAPFAGAHGWYWSNRSDKPVTVTVKTSGFYEKLYKP
jgi:hypothetical protein